MGVETGALIGSSLVMQGLSNSAAKSQNTNSLRVQQMENEKNRIWQSHENAVDREFQAQQQESILNTQQDFQKEMYNLQNEYNLPSNQIARLMAAGINPSALLGSGSGMISVGGGASVPAAASPSAIGSHSVSMPAQLSVPTSNVAQMFSSIAQLQDSLTRSALAGQEYPNIKPKAESEIRRNLASAQNETSQANLNKANQAVKEFELLLKQNYGDAKEAAEINKLVADSYQAYATGQAAEAKQLLDRANAQLSQIESKIKSDAYPDIVRSYGILNDLYQSEKSLNVAKSYEAASQGDVNLVIRRINEYEADLRRNAVQISNETLHTHIENIKKELRQKNLLNDKIEQEIKSIEINNKFLPAEKFMHIVRQVTGTLKDVSSSYNQIQMGNAWQ